VPAQPVTTPGPHDAIRPQQPPPAADANSNLRERVMRPKSMPLVVLGVVTLTASAITLYGAYAMVNLELLCNVGHSGSSCDEYGKSALGLGLGSLVLIGVGIPMIVIGSKRVPATEGPKSAVPSRVQPEATLGPFVTKESAGLRFQLTL
jgi:hypothetical protein